MFSEPISHLESPIPLTTQVQYSTHTVLRSLLGPRTKQDDQSALPALSRVQYMVFVCVVSP